MSHPPLKAVPPSGPLLRQWSNVLYWQDQAALRTYMVDLHQQVLDLVRSGRSWDQLYRNVRFSDEVKGSIVYDAMHTLIVLGMQRWVTNHRRGAW